MSDIQSCEKEKLTIKDNKFLDMQEPNKSLSEIMLYASSFSNQISEMIRPLVESITNVLIETDCFSELRNTVNAIANNMTKFYSFDFSPIFEKIKDFSKIFSSVFKNIQIPGISEEEKEKYIESQRQWGEYGWTMNPCAAYGTMFVIAPETKEEADAVALKNCRKKTMPLIFEEIRKRKKVRREDFEEAVFDFNNSEYKSCALILFTLIDAQLIRLQKKSDFDSKQSQRKVGAQAVKKAKTKAEDDLDKRLFFTTMFCSNLFACLFKVFENGNDFRRQPQVINRNFLNHGMLTRRVTRKDCIQLFLLYYNMLSFIEMI